MKNGKKAALMAAAVTLCLAACGGKASETAASGEMVVPEMSSEELLASSLEYLLLEENETEPEAARQMEEELQTPEDAEEDEATVTPKQQDAATVEAVIYYGNGASDALNRETAALEALTPEALIDALAKHNIVSLDTKVLSFTQEEQDAQQVLRLDLSKAAGEYLRTMSKEAECIIVAALVDTFLENYAADGIYLMVEGEALTTSHRTYTEAVGYCTPEELRLSAGADGDEAQDKLPLLQEKE